MVLRIGHHDDRTIFVVVSLAHEMAAQGGDEIDVAVNVIDGDVWMDFGRDLVAWMLQVSPARARRLQTTKSLPVLVSGRGRDLVEARTVIRAASVFPV